MAMTAPPLDFFLLFRHRVTNTSIGVLCWFLVVGFSSPAIIPTTTAFLLAERSTSRRNRGNTNTNPTGTTTTTTFLKAIYSEILRDVDDPSGRFVGDWDLLSWHSDYQGKRSYPFGWDAIGRLMYSPEGRMCVHLSKRRRTQFTENNPFAAPERELAAAFLDSLAYTGQYTVSPNDQTITHNVLASTDPAQTSSELTRDYAFDDDSKILFLSLEYEGGSIVQTWKRMGPRKTPRRRREV